MATTSRCTCLTMFSRDCDVLPRSNDESSSFIIRELRVPTWHLPCVMREDELLRLKFDTCPGGYFDTEKSDSGDLRSASSSRPVQDRRLPIFPEVEIQLI